MRRRNNRNNNTKKERAIMVASSVFVLAALTMTGIYVKQNSSSNKNDGYSIDFSALENNSQSGEDLAQNGLSGQDSGLLNMEDDLDYFPPLEEAGSGLVEIPGVTTGINNSIGQNKDTSTEKEEEEENTAGEDAISQENLADEAAMAADAGLEENVEQMPEEEHSLSFGAGDTLVWPVAGNVIINYSMDKTTYFATLEQYKYNPSIVIEAAEGDAILAAAAGKVTDVFYDEEIGNAVKVDIGNGYEITYGQLKEIQVSVGSYMEAGTTVGYVAAPTKYYSVEGSNVYFALTKDGEPVNPLGQLQ